MSDAAPKSCSHCGDAVPASTIEHWTEGGEGYGHTGLCCDCFDLDCGRPIEMVNADRVAAGKKPVGPFPVRPTL